MPPLIPASELPSHWNKSEFQICKHLAQAVKEAGGRALVTGGAVRDALLGLPSKDLDLEVFGVFPDKLESILARFSKVEKVGKAFGVYKLLNHQIDVSIPRKEIKVGEQHRDFTIETNPELSLEEAANRRDFTINTLAFDPLEQSLHDPTKRGLQDLENRLLHHVSPAFAEDPLRVLRAMQFAGRFECRIAPETIAFCTSLTPHNLSIERIWDEWKKWILKSKKPSIGLQFLDTTRWIQYYPELEALKGVQQDNKHHPEGDVWTHTLHCIDAFAERRINDHKEDLVVGLAVLLHDCGKPATTQWTDGRWRALGHEEFGLKPARIFLERLTRETTLIDAILPLVKCHGRPRQLHEAQSGNAAIRRLAVTVGRLDRLIRVSECDVAGRPPLPTDFPAGVWLLDKAKALNVEKSTPIPLIQGRHLLELGFTSGPKMGQLLNHIYELQIEGKIVTLEAAQAYATKRLPKS